MSGLSIDFHWPQDIVNILYASGCIRLPEAVLDSRLPEFLATFIRLSR
jgi:hypothetical protein